MNTIYGKILWRTFSSGSLTTILSCFVLNSLSSIPLGRKNTTLFYRSVTDSLTTHPQQIRALAKQKMG